MISVPTAMVQHTYIPMILLPATIVAEEKFPFTLFSKMDDNVAFLFLLLYLLVLQVSSAVKCAVISILYGHPRLR